MVLNYPIDNEIMLFVADGILYINYECPKCGSSFGVLRKKNVNA